MHRFSFFDGVWSVARLGVEEEIPEWVRISAAFVSITRTRDELSIVCPSSWIPPAVKHEPTWSVIKLHGPFFLRRDRRACVVYRCTRSRRHQRLRDLDLR